MANELTNTELAARIREVWPPLLIAAVYDEDALIGRVLNAAGDVSGPYDQIHIATEPTLSAVAVSSDGSVTVSQQTVGDVSLTVDKHYAVADEWLRKTRAQSLDDWFQAWPRAAGKALRQQIDADILALVRADVSTNVVGDGTGHAGEDDLLAAMGKLKGGALPVSERPGEFTWAFDPDEFQFLKKQGFLDYSRRGESGGGSSNARLEDMWGIPVVFNRQVEASGGINYNCLFHKTAFAAAVQKNVEFRMAEGTAAKKLTTVCISDVLYGVKTPLQARACQIKTLDI
jgi:hypothetical protein